MKVIDKDIVLLTINMDLIKEALQTRGKILSTVANFLLFCDDLQLKKCESQQELKFLSESINTLNNFIIHFGRLVSALQQKLKSYEAEQVKRTTSLQELQPLLLTKIEILQRGYKETEAILATLEMSTLDSMENILSQIQTHTKIIGTLLETWHNDLTLLKSSFVYFFIR